jgi:hypothetical protein
MKRKGTITERSVDLQEKALIVKLALAFVPQRAIREIVECDMNRVKGILRHLPKRPSKGAK